MRIVRIIFLFFLALFYSLNSSAALLTNLLHILFRFLLLVAVLTNQTPLQRQLPTGSLTDHGPPFLTGHAAFGVLVYLEDCISRFLRNVGIYLPNYMALYGSLHSEIFKLSLYMWWGLRIYTKTCWAH